MKDTTKLKKVLSIIIPLCLVIVLFVGLYMSLKPPANAIMFQDKEVERLMKHVLDKQGKYITLEDIDSIEVIHIIGSFMQVKRLNGPYFGDDVYWISADEGYKVNGEWHTELGKLKTLADFVQFPNLVYLSIDFQDNPDISALKDMKKLRQLKLYNDNVRDISVLADMKQLKHVDLSFNPMADFAVLNGLDISRENEEYWKKGD